MYRDMFAAFTLLRCTLALCLLSLAGCGMFESEAVKAIRDLTKALNGMADCIEGITDGPTAAGATADFDDRSTKLIEKLRAMPEIIRKHRDDKVSQTLADQLNKDMKEAMQRFHTQVQRLGQMRDLPIEFWNVAKLKAAELVILSFEMAGTMGQQIMNTECGGQIRHIRDMLVQHGHAKVVMVELTNLPASLSQKAFDKLTAAADGAGEHHAAAMGNYSVILAPVNDYKSFIAKLDLGTIVSQDEPKRELKIEVDRRKLGARANSDAEEQQLVAAEMQRAREEQQREIAKHQAETRRDIDRHFGREELDPKAPDYHEKLAEQMTSDNHFQREQALDALLKIDPDEVQSADTRKKIARNFKELAEDSHGFDKGKAVRGLVRWGGKFSVPILLEMLDDSHHFEKDEIFKALGELQDPRAVSPVIGRLGDFSDHEKAKKCLKRMGPVAEDGVILIGPSNDPKICLAAIEILAEIGTKKSFPFLREAATRSRNPDVKSAAKAAIKMIQTRQNASAEDEKDK